MVLLIGFSVCPSLYDRLWSDNVNPTQAQLSQAKIENTDIGINTYDHSKLLLDSKSSSSSTTGNKSSKSKSSSKSSSSSKTGHKPSETKSSTSKVTTHSSKTVFVH